MAKPSKTKHKRTIANRRARHDYYVNEDLVAGMQLTGAETRAIRQGQADLKGAYVTIKDDELWLINCTVSGTQLAPITESDKTRSRKLLVKAREIKQLIEAKNRGMTIIPLEILSGGKYIKIRIAAATGKKHYDKRATLKAREAKRNIERFSKTNR